MKINHDIVELSGGTAMDTIEIAKGIEIVGETSITVTLTLSGTNKLQDQLLKMKAKEVTLSDSTFGDVSIEP